MIRKFDLNIERSVVIEALGSLKPGEAAEKGAGLNRQYCDHRRISWKEAQRILEFEESILEQLQSASDFEEAYDCVEEELDDLYERGECLLMGLDLGVASSVAALSAARCIPFTSCNGGVFGQMHQEAHPLVAFYAKPAWIPELMAAAEEANAGLYNSGEALVVYAEIQDMLAFSRTLIARRGSFRKLKSRDPRNRCETEVAKDHTSQLELQYDP
jgi:hypothetical protein